MATHQYSPRHSNGNGRRDPRELENEIAQTRCEMDETINQLSERLSPRHLMDVAYDYFRSTTSNTFSKEQFARQAKGLTRTTARQIKEHPIPAMLIGAGLLWMLFEDDQDDERDFHSQWADIPEYSGSFVDARTGEPYDLETYGAEWKQEAPAWHPSYDWTKSQTDEASWSQRASQSLDEIRSTLGHASMSAYDKLKHVSARIAGLSGHQPDEMRSRWKSLRSYGGSWTDMQTGQPYDPTLGRQWESLMACDYFAGSDWPAQAEASWTEKAQHALEEMQQSLGDTGRSAKEQIQSLASKIGEFAGSTRDMSSDAGQAMYRRASQAGESLRQGAQYMGRKARRGGATMQQQMQRGYACSRDAASEAIDEYPLAAGAAFLGLGLLLGFALPRTRYEDQMLGERSDELKHYAKETGLEAAERAKHVAQATAAAALDEAEQQGLAPHQLGEKVQEAASSLKQTVQGQDAGSSVHTLAEKVASIAERAVTTAKEETRKEAGDMT